MDQDITQTNPPEDGATHQTATSARAAVDAAKARVEQTAADVAEIKRTIGESAAQNAQVFEQVVEHLRSLTELNTALFAAQQSKGVAEAVAAEGELSLEDVQRAFDGKTQEEQLALYRSMSQQTGVGIDRLAQLVHSSEFERTISAPIHPDTTPDYAMRQMVNDAHDTVCLRLALKADGRGIPMPSDEAPSAGVDRARYIEQLTSLARTHEGAAALLRATTMNTGDNAAVIPTNLSSQFKELFERELRVAGIFTEVTMTSNPFHYSYETTRLEAFRATEATAIGDFFTLNRESVMGTDKAIFDAETLAVLTSMTSEFQQDEGVQLVQRSRRKIARALALGYEDVTINGSVATDDLDNQGADGSRLWANTSGATVVAPEVKTGTADRRYSWDGLRKLTQSGQKYDFGNPSTLAGLEQGLRMVRSKMGEYGASPEGLVHIWPLILHVLMLDSQRVLTLEKYGAQATVLQGELMRWDGSPVIVTSNVYENLNASGVYDDTTKNRTINLLVHREAFVRGLRRGIQVNTQSNDLIGAGQTLIGAHMRADFQRVAPSTEPVVAMGYNIPTAPFA